MAVRAPSAVDPSVLKSRRGAESGLSGIDALAALLRGYLRGRIVMKSWPAGRYLLPRLLIGWCYSVAVHAAPATAPHAFGVRDLVMLQRVADPQLSPDGHYAAFTVQSTDYAADRTRTAIYLLDLRGRTAPPRWIARGDSPRWAPNGQSLYYLAPQQGVEQLWRQPARTAAAPQQVTQAPLDVRAYKLSPDGKAALLAYAVFIDCADLACTEQRLAKRAVDKSSGHVYQRLFVRHWDSWSDGRRNQLFYARFDAAGRLPAEPVWLSRALDGDVPSKPFGDDSEFAFAPDGKYVYFDLRLAGKSEPWSTNFDIYRVPVTGAALPSNLTANNRAWDAYPVPSPDGKTLYYLAMKQPGFEADRFAVMALDLRDGQRREVDPQWDRSAASLAISPDGKRLYVSADDEGQHPLFSIDPVDGKVRKRVDEGTVAALSLGADSLLLAKDDLRHPTDLYLADAAGGGLKQVTHFNRAQLAQVKMGQPEFFSFSGWNGQRVQGYVVKPVDYQAGRRYPVAFIIHGGPQGAMGNDWNYRWNPQTYAGQGFAVVTVNFHGSTGYGQAFTDSISGDWGGKPLQDLQLGWRAAL
ncbi:peptidase s9, partial [Lasius niger]